MFTKRKILVLILVSIIPILVTVGCWNYNEVNERAIVTGFAVDMKEDLYVVTVEVIGLKPSEKEVSMKPEVFSTEGRTIFDCIRTLIAQTGRKLYWGHAKVLILSKNIDKPGFISVLDWTSRDSEVREDMWVVVSQAKTAGEILRTTPELIESVAYEMDEIFDSAEAVAKYDETQIWELIEELSSKGVASTVPNVWLMKDGDKQTLFVEGSSIIKSGRVIGELNSIETRSKGWIRDELKGGILVALEDIGPMKERVSLELLGAKTKLKPIYEKGRLTMTINTTLKVVIAEIGGDTNYIDKQGRQFLKVVAEEEIKKQFMEVIKKTQEQYKADVFGFGQAVQREMPDLWKTLEDEWADVFSKLDTKVNIEVDIKGSALRSKPIIIKE